MGDVTLSIYGKDYTVSCDDGEENRVNQLGQYIDAKVRDIAYAGAASSPAHMMVLASLLMADELFESRQNSDNALVEETAQSVERMAMRIDRLATQIEKAV